MAATNEGLTGHAFSARVADLMQNPTEAIVKAADENASYQTYQKKLGQVGNALSMLSNSHPLAKLVMPFVKTPTNLLKYAGERSLLWLFSQEVRNNLLGRNGAPARDTQAARLVMGTALSTWAVSAALDGTITGGGPTDKDERAVMMLSGWRPYSVRIGNSYYSYASLEPFSTLLGVAADMAEVAKASTDDENENIGKMIFASVVKNLKDKTSLRGPSDLIKATSDPDRYGDKYVQRMLATVVPTFVADAAKTQDPYLREARTTIDAIKARMPGLSLHLLPQRDVWGEPIERQGAVGPTRVYQSRINDDPVNQALIRLQYFPGKLRREIKGVELTDQQYDDYARMAGRSTKMRLDAVVNQPGFTTLPAFVQRTIIDKTIDRSRAEAATVVQMQYPEIIQQAIENKREILNGAAR